MEYFCYLGIKHFNLGQYEEAINHFSMGIKEKTLMDFEDTPQTNAEEESQEGDDLEVAVDAETKQN